MEQRLAMGRKDIFRMRKQNTSRPPSMHVDDFMAIGVRNTCTLTPCLATFPDPDPKTRLRPGDKATPCYNLRNDFICTYKMVSKVSLPFPSLLSLVPTVLGGEEPWACRIWPPTMLEPSCSSSGGGGWAGCIQEWDSTRGETLPVRNLSPPN